MKRFIIIVMIVALGVTGLVQGFKWAGSKKEKPSVPSNTSKQVPVQEPELQAQAAVVVNQNDGEIIYKKHGHDRLYPASTTKILTALLALEKCQPEDTVSAGTELYLVPPQSSMAGLVVGQRLTVHELLYALMLPSGNDAAYVLAVHIARQENPDTELSDKAAVRSFVAMMNQRAGELGALDSHFANPDGYHDASHYSSAHDLAVIAGKAMQKPLFREVVGTASSAYIDAKGRQSVWENTNELIQTSSPNYYPGATGIKTGHTKQAGYCLVSAASRGQKQIISVVMDSTETSVFDDSRLLLDYGFNYQPPSKPETKAKLPYKGIAMLVLAYLIIRVLIGRKRRQSRKSRRIKT